MSHSPYFTCRTSRLRVRFITRGFHRSRIKNRGPLYNQMYHLLIKRLVLFLELQPSHNYSSVCMNILSSFSQSHRPLPVHRYLNLCVITTPWYSVPCTCGTSSSLSVPLPSRGYRRSSLGYNDCTTTIGSLWVKPEGGGLDVLLFTQNKNSVITTPLKNVIIILYLCRRQVLGTTWRSGLEWCFGI